MRKLFVFVFGLVVLTGCGRKTTAQEIVKFVEETYTDVFSVYTQKDKKGEFVRRSEFDKKYLTKRLQTLINNEEFIDCDYWLQAQDFTTPTFKIKDYHVTDKDSGYVDIEIKVFGETDKEGVACRVVVKKENGKWKIDDFQQKYEGEYRGWQ